MGHIVVESSQQEKEFLRLNNLVSRSNPEDNLNRLKKTNFSFETADLFSLSNISQKRTALLKETRKNQRLQRKGPEYRLFLREVPLQSTQFHASKPTWAGGSQVRHSLGPFSHVDGRKYWYDFYKIEKLIALYIAGKPEPALLFTIKPNRPGRGSSLEASRQAPERPSSTTLASSSSVAAHDIIGDTVSLFKKGTEFKTYDDIPLLDGGKNVLELMDINKVENNIKKEGYKLLRPIEDFDLPDTEWELIDIGGSFRVYIEYKGSSSDPSLPSPQIEFAPELKPVIEILQILQDLQGENYAAALQKGLKLAMSNKAGSWEYKFEASKEIPVLRFPPGPLYNDPNQPLKLEAGLKLGAYFNAAVKVDSDSAQLLPSAGGYLGFYGKLSVMCVSISAATVYAVGQVNLDIGADTKTGPSLAMKFGFGAQIVVGLPVVGSVSVLYMVGVEIYVDSVQLNISAFLLFQGHAELLGGIVSVTITIEAKGTISRIGSGDDARTNMAAQV